MKNTLLALLRFLLLSAPLAATAQQYGDFTYTASAGVDTIEITITGYTGPGGAVTIPGTINSFPVIAIGDAAFQNQTTLISVAIPGTVANIGKLAFDGCTSLIAISVDATNASYSSLDGVLFNKNQSKLIQCPGGKPGSYPIPGSVTNIGDLAFNSCIKQTDIRIPGAVVSIGYAAFGGCTSLTNLTISSSVTNISDYAFFYCTSLAHVTILNGASYIGSYMFSACASLTNITIPASVTHIGGYAFDHCTSLRGVFFEGDAPSTDSSTFYAVTTATIYHLPGTTGWATTFAGRPAVLWNPLMQSGGVGPAGFGFNITGTTSIPIVIEAAASLANAAWVPLQSLNLTNGAFYFSDPNWTNYPARFYRIRSP